MTGFANIHTDLAQSATPSQQDLSSAETKIGFLEVSLDDGVALKEVRTSQGALLLHKGLRMLLSTGRSHPIAVDEERGRHCSVLGSYRGFLMAFYHAAESQLSTCLLQCRSQPTSMPDVLGGCIR